MYMSLYQEVKFSPVLSRLRTENNPSLAEIILIMMEKSEGAPSLWQIYCNFKKPIPLSS